MFYWLLSQPPTTFSFRGHPASCMETPPPNSARLPLRSFGAPILLKVCCEKEPKAASSSNLRFSTVSPVEPRMPPPPGVEAEWQMQPKHSLIERLPSPDAPGSWTEKKNLGRICRMRLSRPSEPLASSHGVRCKNCLGWRRKRSIAVWLRVSSGDAARRARLPRSRSVRLCGTPSPAGPFSQFALRPQSSANE